MRSFITILVVINLFSCSNPDSAHLEAFEVYCEMVASDAKPVAFHHPLKQQEVEDNWSRFLEIADSYQVQLYREENFPSTLLFPSVNTEGKTVILIYRGDRLQQYHQWRTDLKASDGSREENESLARRLGRLLGYSPQGINEMLHANTDYDNLALYGVKQQVTHLYYPDAAEAVKFYKDVLGLKMMDSTMVQISSDAFLKLHPVSTDHPAGQPKSTAIALLTDQLPAWYAYLQQKEVPIKYTYQPKDGGPHDGFVAIDPGGYLLEFEQFKHHPENELFMAVLAKADRVRTNIGQLDFYGSITWTYHRDLLRMQNFYEEVLGFRMVADQGWTKIYQTSPTGFIGLVDERRGMEDYADSKAVEIEWKIRDQASMAEYAGNYWQDYQHAHNAYTGPEKYIYHITGD